MFRRLILLRHGQTLHNATRRMQGQLDTELSEAGWEGARRVAEELANAPITRIVSSDLSRAADTAGVVAQRLGLSVHTDRRLRETHLGQWQGLGVDDVDTRWPGARARWRHDASWAPPGGESRLDVARRARPVIDELMDTYDEWDGAAVLVVAHGGTISALTGALLGFQTNIFPLLLSLNNTHFAVLEARPYYDLESGVEVEAAGAQAEPAHTQRPQWYLRGWNQAAMEWS